MTVDLSMKPLSHKDLLTVALLSRDEITMLLETAATLKRDYRPFGDALRGRTLVMLFEKPSLRTRVSFEIGIAKLGGTGVYYDHQSAKIGERETIADYSRNLERWTDCIVARVYSHETLKELAAVARIPVINALSDLYHPCQALADFMTLQERFDGLDGIKLAYVGDGNNVCNSLMHAAAKLGVGMTVITPKGFEPSADVTKAVQNVAKSTGATIKLSNDINAVAGHQAVYTDTWVSMGQETEKEQRVAAFRGYQVTTDVMNKAGRDSVFMHCLPAYRGYEVAIDVIDSPRSIVFDQAENRMHVQNAILLHTIGAAASRD